MEPGCYYATLRLGDQVVLERVEVTVFDTQQGGRDGQLKWRQEKDIELGEYVLALEDGREIGVAVLAPLYFEQVASRGMKLKTMFSRRYFKITDA